MQTTDQRAHDEEGDEDAAERRLAEDVAVTDGRHRDETHVDALPVRQILCVVEVRPRVTGRLHLQTMWRGMYNTLCGDISKILVCEHLMCAPDVRT